MKNKLNIIMIILALVMVLAPLSLADSNNVQSLKGIKAGDNITLTQTCVNVTYVNITSISVSGVTTKQLITTPISMSLVYNGYQKYIFTNTSIVGQYLVTGICDQNGLPVAWSYDFPVSNTGQDFTLASVIVYILFLLVCLGIVGLSISLIAKYSVGKDELKGQDLYEIKKRNNFLFYLTLLKQKFWILGVFGLYLGMLLFLATFSQLVYALSLIDISSTLNSVTLVLTWGLIPFILFWLAYVVIFLYVAVEKIIRFQLGNDTWRVGKR